MGESNMGTLSGETQRCRESKDGPQPSAKATHQEQRNAKTRPRLVVEDPTS